MKKSYSGFTLLEVMIGFTVGAFLLLAFVSLTFTCLRLNQTTDEYARAYASLQEKVGELKNEASKSFSDFVDTYYMNPPNRLTMEEVYYGDGRAFTPLDEDLAADPNAKAMRIQTEQHNGLNVYEIIKVTVEIRWKSSKADQRTNRVKTHIVFYDNPLEQKK